MVSQGVKLTEKQRGGFFSTETWRDCEVGDCEVLEKCAQTGIKVERSLAKTLPKNGENLKTLRENYPCEFSGFSQVKTKRKCISGCRMTV